MTCLRPETESVSQMGSEGERLQIRLDSGQNRQHQKETRSKQRAMVSCHFSVHYIAAVVARESSSAPSSLLSSEKIAAQTPFSFSTPQPHLCLFSPHFLCSGRLFSFSFLELRHLSVGKFIPCAQFLCNSKKHWPKLILSS